MGRGVLVLLVLAGLLAAMAGLALFAFGRARRAKWQISLRGLFGLVTAVAMLLALVFGYRRAVMAQLHWIPPESQEAESLFPAEKVSASDEGEYAFSYTARRRRIQSLLGKLEHASYSVNGESIRVLGYDPAVLNTQLQLLRDSDTLPPGTFVIRGQVVDRRGNPLPKATVDLMGPYVFINHFQTRDDGTFTMPLTDGGSSAPAGSGYWLRIRASEETAKQPVRWNSGLFSLDPAHPERVVRVVVPR